MTMIKGFRDLRVWQAGMELVEQVYRLTQTFPRHEQFGLSSQMQRAAVSIPSNVAEGHTRGHLGEYLQHISIAQSSLAELETQLEIAVRLAYASEQDARSALTSMETLAKQLYSLRNSLRRSGSSDTRHLTPNTQHPTPNPLS